MTRERKVTTFRVDDDLLVAMKALQDRDGMPLSEQIRRALRAWLPTKGVMPKVDRKQAQPKKPRAQGA